jgi:hypothetical protein
MHCSSTSDLQERFLAVDVAKKIAYAAPVGTDKNTVLLTRDYETNARNVARSQAAFAAARLANILNTVLK